MHGDTRQAVPFHDVADHNISIVLASGRAGEDPDARSFVCGQTIAGDRVSCNRVVKDAEGRVEPELEMMGRQRDRAIVRVLPHDVSGDEVLAGESGIVADENAAGVVLDEIASNCRVRHPAQVDSFAAVEPFTSHKIGRQAWTGRRGADIEASVVANHVVVPDGHV